jgi:hypothetical protein
MSVTVNLSRLKSDIAPILVYVVFIALAKIRVCMNHLCKYVGRLVLVFVLKN